MADLERTVLDFYQITNLNPVQWPAEKDNDSDVSDDEAAAKKKANRRKSRYQALERAVSTRSSIVPGSENSGSGVGNLVQRDEPDPLGSTDSVVRTLKHLGVPLQDDLRLRESGMDAGASSGDYGDRQADSGQATDSSSHRRPSPRPYSCRKCMRQLTRNR